MRRVTSSPSVSRGKTHAREPEVEELARLWLGHTAEQPAARVCARAPRPVMPCPTEPTGWGGGWQRAGWRRRAPGQNALRHCFEEGQANLALSGPQTFKCGLTLIRHSPLISVFPPARDSAAHETPRVGSLKGGRLLSARCSVRVSRTGHQISNFQA